jgi:hypothetical protein
MLLVKDNFRWEVQCEKKGKRKIPKKNLGDRKGTRLKN